MIDKRTLPFELRKVGEWKTLIYFAFTEWGALRHYEKGSYIFIQDEEATAAFAVKSGMIGTTLLGSSGREYYHSIRFPHDIFGISELLLRRERTRNALAISASDLWVIPSSRFLELLYSRPEIVLALYGNALYRWTTLNEMRVSPSAGSALQRVAGALKYLAACQAGDLETLSVASFQVTHETIARLCDLSRQTVTSTLDELKSHGLVRLGFRSVTVLDWQALSRIIDGENEVVDTEEDEAVGL